MKRRRARPAPKAGRNVQLFGALDNHSDPEKKEVTSSDQFDRGKCPRRCRQDGGKSESGRACVTNAADHNPQCGSHTGAAALRNAASENVSRIRAGRQVQQDSADQEKGEMMYAEH